MIIDTHAHLMFKDFNADLDAVISRAKAAGVEQIINIGCNKESSKQALDMLSVDDSLYATFGIHPYDALEATDELMAEWEKLILENERIVAVGECGLDYFKAKVSKEDQKRAFRMQLELARKTGVPVVVHNRDADDDTLAILTEFDGSDGEIRVDAVFHCYGSSVEYARKLWYAGYMTSFTGIITYPTATDLLHVVSEVPMDAFMVETDCPYLGPQEYRGQRNEPAYTAAVIAKVAEIKGLPIDEVERISTKNAKEFFLRMN